MRDAAAATKPTNGYTPLVLIQAGSSVPFFCVHGAGGNVLNFRDIARRLGERQTFYGVQAKGVDGAAPLRTIEEMADLYLPEILRVHPHGPYLLGGYSGGGNVAYELAQRLRARDKDVALLVLLDTFRSGIKPIQLTTTGQFEMLRRGGIGYLKERAKARFKRFRWELQVDLMGRFYASQGQPVPYDLRELEMTRAFWAASDSYEPKPYPGPATLYRASYIAPTFQHAGPTLGWQGYIDQLEVVEVPGDHDSLVYEPYVNIMTDHLRLALERASRRGA
ncbi:MAG TPA: alpha/beta fold hydrolase [Polyangiaceae bacterium]